MNGHPLDPCTRIIGIAVTVPEPYGSELRASRGGYGDPLARSVPTHVTLLPPTPVGPEDLPAVKAHLDAVAASHRPFRILLRGTGTFRPVSPVVFVTLAEGIAGCERLERQVRSGPLAQELRFPYHPHVTVAHGLPEDVLDRAFGELSGYQAQFEVDRFHLYEHGPDGLWRPCDAFPLTGDTPG